VINKINFAYERDMTMYGEAAFRKTIKSEDTGTGSSQAINGIKERPELFKFDMVAADAMVTDLAGLYLPLFKDRHWMIKPVGLIDSMAIEFGDTITLGVLGGQSGVVVAVDIEPGNYGKEDRIIPTVLI
jgi:hypothetical protein